MRIKEIKVPDLGGATDVDVIEVHVKAGEHIQKEAPLITLEGDKATMEVPAPEGGIVKAIKVKVGDKVSEGSLILTLEAKETKLSKKPEKPKSEPTPEAEPKPAPAPSPKKSKSKPAPPPEKPKPTPAPKHPVKEEKAPPPVRTLKPSGVHAGPAVRRFARTLGVDLSVVQETGPKGRILKEDVETHVRTALTQKQVAQAQAMGLPKIPPVDFSKFGEVEVKPLSRIKHLMGIHMQRNWQVIPHVTQFDEADITELEAFRQEQQKSAHKKGIKLTLLPFLVKAVVGALKIYPEFNASLDETGENLVLKKYFHIGIAVDTPEGLVVPVVRNVDRLGLFDCAEALQKIGEKARKRSLTPGELQGSCFTISSLGGIGGTAFTPIIHAPDVSILGVSKALTKPVYANQEFKPRLILPLSLSYDHRVIDGATAARFTTTLCHLLSDIRKLLL